MPSVVDSNFASGGATWWTYLNIHVVFDSGPFAVLCENVMSSTKSELDNLLHCHQRRSEPWSQVTYLENLATIGRVVFEIREQMT